MNSEHHKLDTAQHVDERAAFEASAESLLIAAAVLDNYATVVRNCKVDEIERFDYLPQIEDAAETVRQAARAAAPATERTPQPDYSVVQSTDGLGNTRTYAAAPAQAAQEICPCVKAEAPRCHPDCWHFGGKHHCEYCGYGRRHGIWQIANRRCAGARGNIK